MARMIEIEYCAWKLEAMNNLQSVGMTDQIVNAFKQDIEAITLIPLQRWSL